METKSEEDNRYWGDCEKILGRGNNDSEKSRIIGDIEIDLGRSIL